MGKQFEAFRGAVDVTHVNVNRMDHDLNNSNWVEYLYYRLAIEHSLVVI